MYITPKTKVINVINSAVDVKEISIDIDESTWEHFSTVDDVNEDALIIPYLLRYECNE